MELIDLQCSEDLKSKFFTYHILDFYKNHMLSSGWFINLISCTQQEVSMFSTTVTSQQLFSKMKNAENMLCLQLSNHHW